MGQRVAEVFFFFKPKLLPPVCEFLLVHEPQVVSGPVVPIPPTRHDNSSAPIQNIFCHASVLPCSRLLSPPL